MKLEESHLIFVSVVIHFSPRIFQFAFRKNVFYHMTSKHWAITVATCPSWLHLFMPPSLMFACRDLGCWCLLAMSPLVLLYPLGCSSQRGFHLWLKSTSMFKLLYVLFLFLHAVPLDSISPSMVHIIRKIGPN